MEYVLPTHIGAEYMPVDQQFVSLMNQSSLNSLKRPRSITQPT